MALALVIGIILAALLVLLLASGMRVLQDFEQGIHIRLGRFRRILKGGFHWIVPFIDRLIKIDTRTQVLEVPPQDVITKDNAPVRVDGIIISRISDAHKTFYQVGDHVGAITALAQTTLRSVLGQALLDDLLAERDRLNQQLQQILDQHAEPWGIKVSAVEVKHVDLPENMQRSMARQAEAEREKRAKIIHAAGELEASDKLAQAAAVIASQPLSITLRYLQTLTEIAAEKNSTIIFPLPIELLELLKASVRTEPNSR